MNTLNTKSKIETIKCLLLGENGSGKTSFLQTLASGEFPVDFIRSIYQQCSFYVEPKSLNLNQLNTNENGITIEICDSDVTVENLLSQVNLTNYQVILLCFALDNKCTLENIQKKWLKQLKNFDKNYQLPYLLVGLKSDTLSSEENGCDETECSGGSNHNTLAASTVKLHQMDENTTKRSKRTRKTTEQFYRDYAKKLGAYDYLEFSAKNGIQNDEYLFGKICESYYLGNKHTTTRKLFNTSNRYQRLKSTNSTHGDAQLTTNPQQQQQQQQQQQTQQLITQLNKSETIKFKVRTFINRCGRYLFSCASASQEATQKFKRNTQERFSKRPKINKKAHTLLTGVSTLTVNSENENDEVFFS